MILFSTCSMGDPFAIWAPSLWQFIHVSALFVESREDKKSFEQWKQFISNLDLVIPCPKCHGKVDLYCKRYPLTFTKENAFKWSFDFHNYINKSLSKPTACFKTVKAFWSTKCTMHALRCFIVYTANQINAFLEPHIILPVLFTYLNAIDMMYPFEQKGVFLKLVLDELSKTNHVKSLVEIFRICSFEDFLDALSFANVEEPQLEQALQTEVHLDYNVYEDIDQSKYICLSLDQTLNQYDKTQLLRCFGSTDWTHHKSVFSGIGLLLEHSNVFIQVFILRRKHKSHMIIVNHDISISNGFLHRFDVSEESVDKIIGNFPLLHLQHQKHAQQHENIMHLFVTGCDEIEFDTVITILIDEFKKLKTLKKNIQHYCHVEVRDVFLSEAIMCEISEASAQKVFELVEHQVEQSGVCVDFLPENASDGGILPPK